MRRTPAVVCFVVMILAAGAAVRPRVVPPIIDLDGIAPLSESGSAFVEPFVAADLTDSNRLIASASEIVPRGIVARAWVSVNGGRTWASASLPEIRPAVDSGRLLVALDTWVAFSPDGAPYYEALGVLARGERTRTDSWSRAPLLVYRSENHGATWHGPTVIRSRSFDAPKMVAGSGGHVTIAVEVSGTDSIVRPPTNASEQVVVLKSDDGARSFHAARFLGAEHLGRNPANPVYLADTTLVVGWFDHPTFGASGPNEHVSANRIWLARSRDHGDHFEPPRLVGDTPGAGYVIPRFAADASVASRFAGRLYVVRSYGTAEGKSRLEISASVDGGRTFKASMVLSAETAVGLALPAIAVTSDGIVGVAWTARDAQSPDPSCFSLYFTASVDGGESFSPTRRMDGPPSCAGVQANRAITYQGFAGVDTVSKEWPMGGHYIGLAASTDGVFHPVWTDTRDGPFRVYTARIRVREQ